MRVLLVGFSFGVPYRVLRCAAALGVEVFVLGAGAARHLARSRFCAGFSGLRGRPEIPLDEVLRHIEGVALRERIDMVLPADHEAFHVLSLVRERLGLPLFPMPAAKVFAILNDKYRFGRHCRQLGIPHPPTILVEDVAALRSACGRAGLKPPLVVKPLRLSGSQGVQIIAETKDFRRLARLDYRPLLVQQYLPGEDVCGTVFARHGRVVIGQTYRRRRRHVAFGADEALLALCRQAVEALGGDGVFNFDARVSADAVHLIECNPRFFYSMDYAALAGVNFVALGLGNGVARAAPPHPRAVAIGAPLHTLRRLARLARPNADDLAMLRHFLADPLPPLLAEEIPWRRQRLFRTDKGVPPAAEMVRLPASLMQASSAS